MNGLFIIINPVAGHGKAKRVWKRVKRELDRKRVSYRSFQTEYPGHAEVLARQVATIQNYHLKTIICIGGDGTIHELVNGLRSFNNIKIGFISAGIGNDFARRFKRSRQPVKAISHIIQSMDQPGLRFDLGGFSPKGNQSGLFFIHSLEIGFHAEVVKAVEKAYENKYISMLHLEFLTFIIGFLKVLFTYKPVSLNVIVNGENLSYQQVWFLSTINLHQNQGSDKLAQSDGPIDGVLNITVVKNMKRYQFLLLYLLNLTGKHLRSETSIVSDSLTVCSERTLSIQADGDIVGETPVSVYVKKSTVEFIT